MSLDFFCHIIFCHFNPLINMEKWIGLLSVNVFIYWKQHCHRLALTRGRRIRISCVLGGISDWACCDDSSVHNDKTHKSLWSCQLFKSKLSIQNLICIHFGVSRSPSTQNSPPPSEKLTVSPSSRKGSRRTCSGSTTVLRNGLLVPMLVSSRITMTLA